MSGVLAITEGTFLLKKPLNENVIQDVALELGVDPSFPVAIQALERIVSLYLQA